MLPCVSARHDFFRPEGVCHICLTLLFFFFFLLHTYLTCHEANFFKPSFNNIPYIYRSISSYIYISIYINCFRQSTKLHHCITIIAKKTCFHINFLIPTAAPQRLFFCHLWLKNKIASLQQHTLQFWSVFFLFFFLSYSECGGVFCSQ